MFRSYSETSTLFLIKCGSKQLRERGDRQSAQRKIISTSHNTNDNSVKKRLKVYMKLTQHAFS